MNERTQRIACSIAFAITLTQDRLYTANQNTKFLHGAAAAGYGALRGDWMAGTIDPLPVFSALARLMFGLGWTQLSYAIFAALAAAYAWTLTSVVRAAGLLTSRRAHLALFLAGLILTQGVLSRWPDGLAEQYMLDHYLQPCVFGVLLIAGIAQYLRGRTALAIALVVGASVMHPDYLPTTMVCVCTFIARPRDGSRPALRRSLAYALLATALIAPLAIYLRSIVAPTSPELWRRSLDVLVTIRIPHHTEVARWLDGHDVLKLAVMAFGAWLARDRALRGVMWALFALIAGSMVLTALFNLEAVAAITPWRASVLLMPLALAVILARLTDRLASRWSQREHSVTVACACVVVIAVAHGAWRQVKRWNDYASASSMPPIAWVRGHAASPQLYLVPIRDTQFDRFRLETGQPILVNWKTHPYKDVELLEWQRRIGGADAFYTAASARAACEQLSVLAREYGVNAVVYAAKHPLAGVSCVGLTELAHTGDYVVAGFRAATP